MSLLLSGEQVGQGHPARLGRWACGLPARWLHPLTAMRQQGGRILLEPIGEEQRHAARRQHLDDLMHHALGHGERAVTDVDRQQQLAHRVERSPDPLGRAR